MKESTKHWIWIGGLVVVIVLLYRKVAGASSTITDSNALTLSAASVATLNGAFYVTADGAQTAEPLYQAYLELRNSQADTSVALAQMNALLG